MVQKTYPDFLCGCPRPEIFPLRTTGGRHSGLLLPEKPLDQLSDCAISFIRSCRRRVRLLTHGKNRILSSNNLVSIGTSSTSIFLDDGLRGEGYLIRYLANDFDGGKLQFEHRIHKPTGGHGYSCEYLYEVGAGGTITDLTRTSLGDEIVGEGNIASITTKLFTFFERIDQILDSFER